MILPCYSREWTSNAMATSLKEISLRKLNFQVVLNPHLKKFRADAHFVPNRLKSGWLSSLRFRRSLSHFRSMSHFRSLISNICRRIPLNVDHEDTWLTHDTISWHEFKWLFLKTFCVQEPTTSEPPGVLKFFKLLHSFFMEHRNTVHRNDAYIVYMYKHFSWCHSQFVGLIRQQK